ncbi:MAG: 50S ribosomal protein L4 [Candidatus Levybacteria bacterium CG10_big_fil_rev_8_21_14_0_10_36_30]|nr:MAG: 50S ribosomal protein L4 [Candidatus Levybacteria bacterium CG10_big_fil_rev_8_21_14_0_10_36_30]
MPTSKKIIKKTSTIKSLKSVKKVKPVKKVVVKPKASVTKHPVKVKDVKAEKTEKLNLTVAVYDKSGTKTGTLKLPEEIFGVSDSPKLVAQAVRVYLANQRQGPANTKTRGEVAYSTKKIYRQKGTGRARHGARKAPIFVGGGITFGPRTRDFSLQMPQQMKRKALFCALSSKLLRQEIIVVDLSDLSGKTKEIALLLRALSLTNKKGKADRVLFVTDNDSMVKKATKNIGGLTMLPANALHAYGVLKSKRAVFVKEAIGLLENTFLKQN